MAKDKSTTKPEAPSGFTNVNSGRPAGYFNMGEGNILTGLLIGRFESNKERGKFFYQIRVSQDTTAQVSNGDGGWVEGIVESGKLVNVDEHVRMTSLKECSDSDETWEVWIGCGPKIDLPGNRTMWDVEVGKKRFEGAMDDVPF